MQSEAINELAGALAKAQAVVKTALKEKVNTFFQKDGKGGQYSDLPAVWDACREALTANGLAVVQAPQIDAAGKSYLETTLMHSSGQWIKSMFLLHPTKPDMQGVMSALTYARRGALAAMVGVVADADDDGNAASAKGNGNGHSDTITPQQRAELQMLMDKNGKSIEAFCAYYKIDALPDLPASKYADAVKAINAKPKAPLKDAAE